MPAALSPRALSASLRPGGAGAGLPALASPALRGSAPWLAAGYTGRVAPHLHQLPTRVALSLWLQNRQARPARAYIMYRRRRLGAEVVASQAGGATARWSRCNNGVDFHRPCDASRRRLAAREPQRAAAEAAAAEAALRRCSEHERSPTRDHAAAPGSRLRRGRPPEGAAVAAGAVRCTANRAGGADARQPGGVVACSSPLARWPRWARLPLRRAAGPSSSTRLGRPAQARVLR